MSWRRACVKLKCYKLYINNIAVEPHPSLASYITASLDALTSRFRTLLDSAEEDGGLLRFCLTISSNLAVLRGRNLQQKRWARASRPDIDYLRGLPFSNALIYFTQQICVQLNCVCVSVELTALR